MMGEWTYDPASRNGMAVMASLRNATVDGRQVRVTAGRERSAGASLFECVPLYPKLGDPERVRDGGLSGESLRAIPGDIVYFPHHKAWVCVTNADDQAALKGVPVLASKKVKQAVLSSRCLWSKSVPVEVLLHYGHLSSWGRGKPEPFRLWVSMWALRYFRAISGGSLDKLRPVLTTLFTEACLQVETSIAAPVDRTATVPSLVTSIIDAVDDYSVED